jgi:hypothetical protein
VTRANVQHESGLPFERVAAHTHDPPAEPGEKARLWVGVTVRYDATVHPYAADAWGSCLNTCVGIHVAQRIPQANL